MSKEPTGLNKFLFKGGMFLFGVVAVLGLLITAFPNMQAPEELMVAGLLALVFIPFVRPRTDRDPMPQSLLATRRTKRH
jgi:hypothetical protein